jgi:hypothetical protein
VNREKYKRADGAPVYTSTIPTACSLNRPDQHIRQVQVGSRTFKPRWSKIGLSDVVDRRRGWRAAARLPPVWLAGLGASSCIYTGPSPPSMPIRSQSLTGYEPCRPLGDLTGLSSSDPGWPPVSGRCAPSSSSSFLDSRSSPARRPARAHRRTRPPKSVGPVILLPVTADVPATTSAGTSAGHPLGPSSVTSVRIRVQVKVAPSSSFGPDRHPVTASRAPHTLPVSLLRHTRDTDGLWRGSANDPRSCGRTRPGARTTRPPLPPRTSRRLRALGGASRWRSRALGWTGS